jgi:hypothetical protein
LRAYALTGPDKPAELVELEQQFAGFRQILFQRLDLRREEVAVWPSTPPVTGTIDRAIG